MTYSEMILGPPYRGMMLPLSSLSYLPMGSEVYFRRLSLCLHKSPSYLVRRALRTARLNKEYLRPFGRTDLGNLVPSL